jgi:hypothetical protein
MADSTKGELIEDSGDFKYITACQTPEGKALLICIAGSSPTPLPFGSWKGSGTLVGAAIESAGFAADEPNALATVPVQYPRGVATGNLKLSLHVTDNTFVATTTRFEVYRDVGAGPVATGQFIDVAAGVFGNPTVSATFALAFADGNTFDLRVSNPGGAAEVGKVISFGFGAEFF